MGSRGGGGNADARRRGVDDAFERVDTFDDARDDERDDERDDDGVFHRARVRGARRRRDRRGERTRARGGGNDRDDDRGGRDRDDDDDERATIETIGGARDGG